MATKKLEVLITGNARGAQKAFAETERSAGSLGSKLGNVGSKIGTGLALGFGAAATGIAILGPQLFDLQGKLDAWALKTDTVFEGSAATVRKWADSNNEAFGVTDEELSGLAAGFGDLLKPMGFTAEQAATMSMDVVGLSGALSEWSGGQRSAAEVSEILAKAMLGERDSLKELGISISEADVQARLAAKGQDKLTGSALEQAKALATQELIFEKSTDAQKAYREGGNETLRAGNKLKALWGEMQVALADKLVPALVLGAKWLGEMPDKVKAFSDWMGRNKPIVIGVAAAISTVLVAAFASWAAAAIPAAVATVAATWPLLALVAVVAAVAAGLVWAYQNVDWFRGAVQKVASFITETALPALAGMWSWFAEKLLPVLKVAAAFIAREVVGSLQALWGFIRNNVIPVIEGIWSALTEKVIPSLQGFAFEINNTVLPALDSLDKKVRNDVAPALSGFAIWITTTGVPTANALARAVRGVLAPAFAALRAAVSGAAGVMGSAFANSVNVARVGVGNLFAAIRAFLTVVGPTVSAVGGVLSTGFRNLRTAVDLALSAIRTTANMLERIIGLAGRAASAIRSIPSPGDIAGGILSRLPGRAAGGPVLAGSAYMVGERGPELFVPGESGAIIPNDRLNVPIGGRSLQLDSGGAAPTVVNVYVAGSIRSDHEVAQVVRDELIDIGRRTGRPVLAGYA